MRVSTVLATKNACHVAMAPVLVIVLHAEISISMGLVFPNALLVHLSMGAGDVWSVVLIGY
jgi:hypothetical protein